MSSFFEKLTGASEEELKEEKESSTKIDLKPKKKINTEKKKEKSKQKKTDKRKKSGEKKEAKKKKPISKETNGPKDNKNISKKELDKIKINNQFQDESPKTEQRSMPKEKSKKSIKPELEKEKKDWLEEAEQEEGQLTIDVYQTESDVIIKSTIAGVDPEELDISITNDMVTIKGKRSKDESVSTEDYYYQELYWGAFSRSIILPIEVDSDRAKAAIKNGILTIKLPKSEKTKTKKIKVDSLE